LFATSRSSSRRRRLPHPSPLVVQSSKTKAKNIK